MLVDPQDPGTRIVHALADLYLQQLLIPALDGGTPQPLALAKRPLRDPVVVGLEDLAPEGLRRAAAGAYAGEALVEVPSAALAEEFMAFEVKPGRPRPEIGMAQGPDEAVLLPKLRASAPRAARSQERTGMEVNGLHPLHLDDFQERQPDYTGVGLGHGILLNNGSLNQLLRMPAPVFDVEPNRFVLVGVLVFLPPASFCFRSGMPARFAWLFQTEGPQDHEWAIPIHGAFNPSSQILLDPGTVSLGDRKSVV